MSGQTYLCEICRLVIQWSGSMNRWYVERHTGKYLSAEVTSAKPYVHNHRPYGETSDGSKIR